MKYLTLEACLLSSCALATLLFANTAIADASDDIETVVVTGTRIDAQAVKQNAPNVMEVQPLSEIRKLPDVNLAEALQRIPGISLETDSGEGRFINIRGMDADLNGTTYDGVRLTASNASSPQGGARAVAFDAFPPGIVGGLEVIKSLTPDIDAEGLGGVVNMLPRTVPQDRDMFADGSLGSGIETLRGSPVWSGDMTVGGRFGPSDAFTAILSYSYDADWRGIDDIEEDYFNFPTDKRFDDLQLRRYQYHRIRQGLGGGLTFDADNNTTFFLRGFHAGYTEWANKHRLELDDLGEDATGPSSDGTFTVPDASAAQKFTYSKESVTNDLIEAGGRTTFGPDVVADFRGSWTKGIDRFPYSYGFTFTDGGPIALNYNNVIDPSHPKFAVTDGTDLTDPANYPFDKGSNSPSMNWDEETGGAVNFTMPLAIASHDGDLKFGGSVRLRHRNAIAASGDLADGVADMSAFAIGPDQIYYDDTYNIGPTVDLKALAAQPQDVPLNDPSSFENDNENVYAGYVQYNVDIERLSLLGGVRIEGTDGTYRANIIGSDGSVSPNTNKQSYTDVFPDLNAKYQVADDFLVRAAYSTSIARPGFNQITAAVSKDFDANTISEGNPSLKPTTANNFDLTAEYYLPNGGIASAGLFYKGFDNYIIPTVRTVAFVQGFTGPVQINSFANIGSADADGLELNYIQQLQFLPDPFDGLGFEGNLTLVGSHGQIRAGEQHTLPQTSTFNYNAAIFYEKGPLSLRLAASFVSRNLWAVGDDTSSDQYSQPRFRLDFGGSYQITENFEYYVDVKNITDTKLEFTLTPNPDVPIQREFYSVDVLTGLRVRF